jgi:hypothetical protein
MRNLALGLVASCALWAACTTENPHYTGASDFGPGGDAAIGGDLASPIKPGSSDMAIPVTCVDGQRGCNMSGALGCVGGVFVEDRICPASSVCTAGHCPAPTGGPTTVGKDCAPTGHPTESLCVAGLSGSLAAVPSCQPFLGPMFLTPTWVCAPRIGMGLPGQACTSGAMCRSGFCGGNGTCFRACISAADCPTQGGPWKCEAVKIVVEGVQVQAPSCIL